MTDEDGRRILREARATLAAAPEPYVPPPEPLLRIRKRYDPPEPERERESRLDTVPSARAAQAPDWSAWELWVSTRIDAAIRAEREAMSEIIARVIADTRRKSERASHAQMRDLRTEIRALALESAKLSATLDSLHDMVSAERSRVLDLPALPSRRSDFN